MVTLQSKTLELFAEVFEYPGERLPAVAYQCADLVAGASAEAASEMREFGRFAESMGSERMEEVYTRTFDVTPTTTLYVGYHLFGDSYKRGAFLVALQEKYRALGFSAGGELVDHLAPILRFASLTDDAQFTHPLLFEAVLPALAKVEEAFRGSDNAYRLCAGALKGYLEAAGADYLAVLPASAEQESENPGAVIHAQAGSQPPAVYVDARLCGHDVAGNPIHEVGVQV